MEAICIHGRGGPEWHVFIDVPQPHPGPGEVLVRVYATSLTALTAWQAFFDHAGTIM